jgi:hypothetical protein
VLLVDYRLEKVTVSDYLVEICTICYGH